MIAPHGGYAIPGTTSPMVTTQPIATWTCGGNRRVRTQFSSMIIIATTVPDHTIASPRAPSQSQNPNHRHRCRGTKLELASIAPRLVGESLGCTMGHLFATSQDAPGDMIAIRALPGAWWSGRMALGTKHMATKGMARRQAVIIVPISHAGLVGIFLMVEFGRFPLKTLSSLWLDDTHRIATRHLIAPKEPRTIHMLVGGGLRSGLDNRIKGFNGDLGTATSL